MLPSEVYRDVFAEVCGDLCARQHNVGTDKMAGADNFRMQSMRWAEFSKSSIKSRAKQA